MVIFIYMKIQRKQNVIYIKYPCKLIKGKYENKRFKNSL
jgi:hypothetical protein